MTRREVPSDGHDMLEGRWGQFSVCVYCASGPVAPEFEELAAEVGAEIGRRGWTLVSGGGRVSMMGAVARAARETGARSIGVIPRALMELEVADIEADDLLITDNMRDRKGLMDAHADAFLALPGGLGTLEELTEVWTSLGLGMHSKPVVLLDPDGHYAGLLDWLAGMVSTGFVSQAMLDVLPIATTVEDALNLCEDGTRFPGVPTSEPRT